MGISETTLRRLVNKGEIPVVNITSRLLFLESDLEAYLESKRGVAATKDERSEYNHALPKHVQDSSFFKNRKRAA